MKEPWKHIDTAPMDGTRFLAYGFGPANEEHMLYDRSKDRVPSIRICWRVKLSSVRDVDMGQGLFRKEPYTSDYGWKGWCFEPTHWMPLPDAPAGQPKPLSANPPK